MSLTLSDLCLNGGLLVRASREDVHNLQSSPTEHIFVLARRALQGVHGDHHEDVLNRAAELGILPRQDVVVDEQGGILGVHCRDEIAQDLGTLFVRPVVEDVAEVVEPGA